nr:hypothetical protein [Halomonas tianxiuensis]
MVKLTRIYTRTGDKGDTGLGDGSRVAKHDLRVEAFGTVDETNAVIGLAQLHATGELRDILATVQNDLFDVGADLCTPEQEAPEYHRCGSRLARSSIWKHASTPAMPSSTPCVRSSYRAAPRLPPICIWPAP